ncbi:unnamed protein product [Prorocentrum cordatum]|uniref:DUF3987 domain-containing protein n=1 Tax=Prorocentrum cordatum TaxID=2364126 RepID=A0ABN9V0S4_9DINO|nr:unnamed protein product [Polarella glacialis]
MASLPLNAVKVHYSGILGVFPNIMINAHGASGDGKSVALWFDTQVMHYWRKKNLEPRLEEWKDRKDAYDEWKANGRDPSEAVPEPGPEPAWEKLYDSGSMVGLGVQMKGNDGVAFLIEHEGGKWLNKLLEGGVAGSVGDLNQIAEHAFFKNAPSNKESRFRVENPHLVCFIPTHMDEIVPILQQARGNPKDSVAGMQRFLYCHFPAVCKKVLPEGSEEELAELVQNSEDYFNELSLDDAVKSVVHPLLLMEGLHKMNVERQGERGNRNMFSNMSGQHVMAWEPGVENSFAKKFNESAEKIAAAFQRLGSRVDASKLSKDKTRPLQFLPAAALLEKAIEYLVFRGVQVDPSKYSPEELVEQIARVDIDNVLGSFVVTDIPSRIPAYAVEAGEALGAFFEKQCGLLASMPDVISRFRERRDQLGTLHQPRAHVLFALLREVSAEFPLKVYGARGQLVHKRFSWAEFCGDPDTSEDGR